MAGKKKPSARGSRKRRSKAESSTGSKENSVEVRTAGIGYNSEMALPAPDDWNHHKKTINGWKEKVSTATSGLRNAKKAALKAGVDLESMDLVVKVERRNDPAKAANFFNQVGLGLELGETSLRVTVHDTLAGDEADLVYKRGFADGEAGRTAESKYPENSDLAKLYAKGWRHGTAKNLGLTPEQSDEAVAEESPEKIAAE